MFSSSHERRVMELAMAHGAAAYFRKGQDTVDEVVAFLAARIPGAV